MNKATILKATSLQPSVTRQLPPAVIGGRKLKGFESADLGEIMGLPVAIVAIKLDKGVGMNQVEGPHGVEVLLLCPHGTDGDTEAYRVSIVCPESQKSGQPGFCSNKGKS